MQKMTKADVAAAVAKLPGWSVKDGKLHREYKFADFPHAFGFMATAAPMVIPKGTGSPLNPIATF